MSAHQANDHHQWAKDFTAWAGTNAFGVSTVAPVALRTHALENNPVVRAAAEAVTKAQSAVNKTLMAIPFVLTPPEHASALAAAKADLRKALRDARAEAAGV